MTFIKIKHFSIHVLCTTGTPIRIMHDSSMPCASNYTLLTRAPQEGQNPDLIQPLKAWSTEKAQPWPLTLTSIQVERQRYVTTKHNLLLYDLDLWPTTLNYNPKLAKVKVNLHIQNQDHRSNSSNRRAQTNRRTDKRTNGRYQTHYLTCFAVDNKEEYVSLHVFFPISER